MTNDLVSILRTRIIVLLARVAELEHENAELRADRDLFAARSQSHASTGYERRAWADGVATGRLTGVGGTAAQHAPTDLGEPRRS